MYMYIYICIYIYVYIIHEKIRTLCSPTYFLHAHTHIYTHMYTHIYTHNFAALPLAAYTCIDTYTHAQNFALLFDPYTHIYIHTQIHTLCSSTRFLHTHTHTHNTWKNTHPLLRMSFTRFDLPGSTALTLTLTLIYLSIKESTH